MLTIPAYPGGERIRPRPHGKIPTRKHQDPRMAFQRSCHNLAPLNAETDAIGFNSGKGCQGNARERREQVPVQFLKLTKDGP
jgi:hypothetical protein